MLIRYNQYNIISIVTSMIVCGMLGYLRSLGQDYLDLRQDHEHTLLAVLHKNKLLSVVPVNCHGRRVLTKSKPI